MKAQDYQISSEKFVFHSVGEKIHDKKLDTKPVSYLEDAFRRFARNKASIAAFVIIVILFLFAMVGPLISPYSVSYKDENFSLKVPKLELFYDLGIPFWDGGAEKEVGEAAYLQYKTTEMELKDRKIIMSDVEETINKSSGNKLYKFRLDTYNAVGVQYLPYLTNQEYIAIQKYQDEHNVQIILPYVKADETTRGPADMTNGSIWYKTKLGAGMKTEIVYDEEGNLIPAYEPNNGGDGYYSKMLYEGEEKQYSYARRMQGDMWHVRVDYIEYYKYYHQDVLDDGIEEPSFIFGTDDAGRDLFIRLATGARFSFILAIIVASFNLIVGAIYGSIEGYYGGKIDILMERIVDILGSIPMMIVISLLKYNLDASDIVIIFLSFFITGWTGMAGRTRMQFYRFKNQEYVLVARTLGAKDSRIMFKHIFPNAIGTLITGSVLVIPGVIFSETSLSYLGIVNLDGDTMTSVGTLLSKGQGYLFTHPHIILFPAIFISLLMLCFNLFGNGLRDAFNPSLRGNEE